MEIFVADVSDFECSVSAAFCVEEVAEIMEQNVAIDFSDNFRSVSAGDQLESLAL
jgi:hypothetical protein